MGRGMCSPCLIAGPSRHHPAEARRASNVCGGIRCDSQGFPRQRACSCSRERSSFVRAEQGRAASFRLAMTRAPPTPEVRTTMDWRHPAGRRPVPAAVRAAARDRVATTGRPRATTGEAVRQSAAAAAMRTATAKSARTTQHAAFKGRRASIAPPKARPARAVCARARRGPQAEGRPEPRVGDCQAQARVSAAVMVAALEARDPRAAARASAGAMRAASAARAESLGISETPAGVA